ncbi:MAG: acyltransferase family protein [Deltaproteobacteria bacterium]|nr:acyltransferase family protein [Deltaproteobacteria bacterium]
MNRQTSIYLDLIRFGSALLVLFSHLSFERFTGHHMDFMGRFGQVGVLFFFVLSGYVIAFVTDTRQNGFRSYMTARFARLYSVIVPALLIVPILDFIGGHVDMTFYGEYLKPSTYPAIRAFIHFVFSQQLWFLNIQYFSDGPFWSLGHEFWYYLLFGFAMFLEGKRKYLLIILISVLIGPKILLLMVPWLFGVWGYRFHRNKVLSRKIANLIFWGSPILFLIFLPFEDPIDAITRNLIGDDLHKKLMFSRNFVFSYMTAFCILLNIISIKYIEINFVKSGLFKGENFIRYLANCTFTIYLFHFPLLLFYGALLRHSAGSLLDVVLLFGITFISCLFLASFTEKKKHVFKRCINAILNRGRVVYQGVSLWKHRVPGLMRRAVGMGRPGAEDR